MERKLTIRHWFLIGAVIVLAGLAVAGRDRLTFDTPTAMTLYSLHGFDEFDEPPRDGKIVGTGQKFHGFPVLGKTDIASAADRRKILKLIKKGIADSNGSEAKCFWPHHGVRLTQNGKNIEYVICFTCSQLNVYTDGQLERKPTFDAASDVLNQHFETAGIPREK